MGHQHGSGPVLQCGGEYFPWMDQGSVYESHRHSVSFYEFSGPVQRQAEKVLLVSVAQIANQLKGVFRAANADAGLVSSTAQFQGRQNHGRPGRMDSVQFQELFHARGSVAVQNSKQRFCQGLKPVCATAASQNEHQELQVGESLDAALKQFFPGMILAHTPRCAQIANRFADYFRRAFLEVFFAGLTGAFFFAGLATAAGLAVGAGRLTTPSGSGV